MTLRIRAVPIHRVTSDGLDPIDQYHYFLTEQIIDGQPDPRGLRHIV